MLNVLLSAPLLVSSVFSTGVFAGEDQVINCINGVKCFTVESRVERDAYSVELRSFVADTVAELKSAGDDYRGVVDFGGMRGPYARAVSIASEMQGKGVDMPKIRFSLGERSGNEKKFVVMTGPALDDQS